MVFSPYFPSHHAGGVPAVTDSHHCGVVDESWYLLAVTGIGEREKDSSKLSFCIASSMELEAIVPPLVVAAEGRYPTGDFVPVSSY